MSKHRLPGATQGQSGQQRSSLSSSSHQVVFCCLTFILGYERGLDVEVSYKFSSILGMLTTQGPEERSLLSLCNSESLTSRPCFTNPKNRAASWSTFLLPWTISTLEPKDLGQTLSVHVCLLRINWLKLSLSWLAPQYCGSGVMNYLPHTLVGPRLQPQLPVPRGRAGGPAGPM